MRGEHQKHEQGGGAEYEHRWRSALLLLKGKLGPFETNARPSAVIFHFSSIICLKDILPRQVESSTVVSDIHHIFAREQFSDLRINPLKDLSAVRDRSFSALGCRLNTKETQNHGPLARIGHLVMERDRLVGRIFSRSVDLAADQRTGSRTIGIVEQLSGQARHKLLEFLNAPDIEGAKQYRSCTLQLVENRLLIFSGPLDQVQTVNNRLK